ncbi:MAG: carbohydrate-binding protein [Phycisphaera sp. RhM]|nr:carbohydrate-binding protein [Phycisphaera sp. RhM]
MKKRIISNAEQQAAELPEGGWLDLATLADVEVTSEAPAHPIESALLPGRGSLWRAAEPGEQTIRLVFTSPQRIQRIALEFVEPLTVRTQQFVLSWSSDGGQSYRELVRQQWNFSPQGATQESEEYRVDLSNVTALELKLTPDVSGGEARATLARLRLA